MPIRSSGRRPDELDDDQDRLARLRTASATCARKFMMPMDVVEAEGGYVILIGSGDREKPYWDSTMRPQSRTTSSRSTITRPTPAWLTVSAAAPT
jgi:hypothetical protein